MRKTLDRFLEAFENFMRFWGLWFFDYTTTPFDDRAHAGEFHGKILTPLQIASLRLRALVGAFEDCLITDTSRWQLDINYTKMLAGGIKGTIIKCGQGAGIDPYFERNYRKAGEAGLKRGTYWYYDSRVAPKEQAALWADAIKRNGLGELPHFGDFEENYGGPYRGVAHFFEFMLEFQRLLHLPNDRMGVYTGYYYWIQHGVNVANFAEWWLWLAWYGPMSSVLIPNPWKIERMWGWQFTDSGPGTTLGVSSKEIDLSYFVHGLAEFEAKYGKTAQLPTGEPMETGMFDVWSDTNYMSMRTGPAVTDTKIGTLPIGEHVIADLIVPPSVGGLTTDKWAHVVSRQGQPVDFYMAIVHNGEQLCQYEPIEQDTRPVPHGTFEFVDRDGKTWVLEGDMVERP